MGGGIGGVSAHPLASYVTLPSLCSLFGGTLCWLVKTCFHISKLGREGPGVAVGGERYNS